MHPLSCATFTCRSLVHSISIYKSLFDYDVIKTGTVPESVADFWQSPNDAGASYALLAPHNGADGGFVRLIEKPAMEAQVPFQNYGWCGAEFVVEDVFALQARLENADLKILMDPKPPWAPMAAAGPDGEGWLFNTPADNNPFNYTVLPARSFVDRISIIVCACKDRVRSETFYAELLGAKPGHRAEMPLPFANRAMELPDETAYKTGAMRLGRTPFIELDQYPEGETGNSHPFESGLVLGTFHVPSLDNVNVSFLSEPAVVDDEFYEGKRCALCEGPDGERIEIIEE